MSSTSLPGARSPTRERSDSSAYWDEINEMTPLLPPAPPGHYGDKPTYKIVMLGDNGVGKTALIFNATTKRYIHSDMPTTEHEVTNFVIEHNFRNKDVNGITMEIHDFGGHWQLTDSEPNINEVAKEADGFMLCFNMGNPLSFNRAKRQDYIRYVYSITDERPVPPILLVACQADQTQSKITEKQVKQLGKDLLLPTLVTSAAAQKNTSGAFHRLCRLIYDHKRGIIDPEYLPGCCHACSIL